MTLSEGDYFGIAIGFGAPLDEAPLVLPTVLPTVLPLYVEHLSQKGLEGMGKHTGSLAQFRSRQVYGCILRRIATEAPTLAANHPAANHPANHQPRSPPR